MTIHARACNPPLPAIPSVGLFARACPIIYERFEVNILRFRFLSNVMEPSEEARAMEQLFLCLYFVG